ncbi:MAG: hypothetical protein K5886_07125 [Lachnospiraceae bacterium]|nr:hypothetical protein [Lachnospiraceae bacterium]
MLLLVIVSVFCFFCGFDFIYGVIDNLSGRSRSSAGRADSSKIYQVTGGTEAPSEINEKEPGATYDDKNKVLSLNALNPGHWEKTDEIMFEPVLIGDKDQKPGDPVTVNTEGKDISFTLNAGGKGTNVNINTGGKDEKEVSVTFEQGKKHTDYLIRCQGLSDRYAPGEDIQPDIKISYINKGTKKRIGDVHGALYLADIKKDDADNTDPFGQDIAVYTYLKKSVNESIYPRSEARHIGIDNRTRDGGDTDDNGLESCYYRPYAQMPQKVSEGAKIWLVFDIIAGESEDIRMRKVWEYSWVFDKADAPRKETEAAEETHEENDPEWIRHEYPGIWNLKDVRYINSEKTEDEKDGVRIRESRRGSDGQDMVYTFTVSKDNSPTGKEETLQFLIPDPGFKTSYYGGESYYEELRIFRESETDGLPAGVICSLAIADVDLEKGSAKHGGITVTPKSFLTSVTGKGSVDTFGENEDDFNKHLNLASAKAEGKFPSGTKDGEKLYLVYGVMDAVTKECRMFNVLEYEWTEKDIVDWQWNKPMTW